MSIKYRFRGDFGDEYGEGNKHCGNQEGSTFSIVIYDCEGNWVGTNNFY